MILRVIDKLNYTSLNGILCHSRAQAKKVYGLLSRLGAIGLFRYMARHKNKLTTSYKKYHHHLQNNVRNGRINLIIIEIKHRFDDIVTKFPFRLLFDCNQMQLQNISPTKQARRTRILSLMNDDTTYMILNSSIYNEMWSTKDLLEWSNSLHEWERTAIRIINYWIWKSDLSLANDLLLLIKDFVDLHLVTCYNKHQLEQIYRKPQLPHVITHINWHNYIIDCDAAIKNSFSTYTLINGWIRRHDLNKGNIMPGWIVFNIERYLE